MNIIYLPIIYASRLLLSDQLWKPEFKMIDAFVATFGKKLIETIEATYIERFLIDRFYNNSIRKFIMSEDYDIEKVIEFYRQGKS